MAHITGKWLVLKKWKWGGPISPLVPAGYRQVSMSYKYYLDLGVPHDPDAMESIRKYWDAAPPELKEKMGKVQGVVRRISFSNEGTDATKSLESNEGTDATKSLESNKGTDATKSLESNEGTDATKSLESNEGTDATKSLESNKGTDATKSLESNKGTDATKSLESNEGTDATKSLESNKGTDATKSLESMLMIIVEPDEDEVDDRGLFNFILLSIAGCVGGWAYGRLILWIADVK